MPNVIVYSVPGTGTRFTHQFLTDVMGYERCGLDHLFDKPAKVWAQTHTDRDITHFLRVRPSIISPLRDPYLSFITRNCRCEPPNVGVLKRNLPELKNIWIAHWKKLISMQEHTIIYLPVDSDLDNRKLLTMVARQFGIVQDEGKFDDTVAQWPKVGTFGNIPLKERYLCNGTLFGEKLTFLDFAVAWREERVEELRQRLL